MFRKLIKEILPFKIHFILLFALSIISSVMNIVPPLLFQYAIDNFIIAGNMSGLWIVLIGLAILGGLMAVHGYFQHRLNQYIGLSIVKNLRNRLFDHISHQSFEFFDKSTTGDLIARITHDTEQLSHFLNHHLVDLVINVFMLIGIFAIFSLWNIQFALVFLCLTPLIYISVKFFTKKVLPSNRQIRLMNSNLTVSIQQCFNGIKEVKIYGREEFMTEIFKKWNDEYLKATLLTNQYVSIWSPLVPLILNIFTVIITVIGALLIIDVTTFTYGELIAGITYFGLLGGPIRSITQFANTYNRAKAAAERIFEIMDRIPSIKDCENALPLEEVRGLVEYKEVCFGYDSAHEILSKVTFTVNSGDILALVGPSGVGKTTLASLLPRFYDPTHGEVLIDGIDIKKIKCRDLRKSVGIVMQNVFLFDGSIRDNIAYGKEEATLQEVEEAAKIAQLDEFVQSLPEKYDTPIGERGVRLSGGQAQRLSIARVLVTNPKVLILDEPTAQVDAITDQKLINAIHTVMKGRTTIMIAHRLLTIKNADKILLLHDGKVEAIGNHKSLLETSAFYREFFASQFENTSQQEPNQKLEPVCKEEDRK